MQTLRNMAQGRGDSLMSGSCSLKMLKLNVTSPTVSVQRVTVPLQVQVRAQCNHCDLSKRILPPERRKNWGSVQNFNPMYCRRSQNMCKQWHHSPRPEFSKREPTPQCGESGCQEMDCWSKSINLFNPRPQKGPAVLPNGFKAKINCYRRCQSHTQISEPEGDATVAMKKLCTESKNPISVDEINAQGYNAMSLNEIKASEKIVGAYPNLNAPSVHR